MQVDGQQQVITEQPPAQAGPTNDQWAAFMGTLANQNQALQAQLSESQAAHYANQEQQRQQAVAKLNDKERADYYEGQMNAIRTAGQQIQQQSLSNTVWQRRDADAAARMLRLHGMDGSEPGLYKGDWDVNWLPRFVASVDGVIQNRKSRPANNPTENPANRANIGNGTGSIIPEVADSASGYDTIRYALSKMRQ